MVGEMRIFSFFRQPVAAVLMVPNCHVHTFPTSFIFENERTSNTSAINGETAFDDTHRAVTLQRGKRL